MKNIKFILPVIIVGLLVPPSQLVIDSLVIVVTIMGFCFLFYGIKNEIPINCKVPTLFKMFIMIFFAINLAYTKFILLSTMSMNMETIGQYSFIKISISLPLKILGSLIIEFFLYHIFGQTAKTMADAHSRFASDSMMQKIVVIDFSVKAEKITKEKAESLKTELQTELEYYSSINDVVKFMPLFFLISSIVSLLPLIGGAIILFCTRTFSLETFGYVVDHFAGEIIVFGLILSMTSFAVSIERDNRSLREIGIIGTQGVNY